MDKIQQTEDVIGFVKWLFENDKIDVSIGGSIGIEGYAGGNNGFDKKLTELYNEFQKINNDNTRKNKSY